jgi:iron(III) transport system ATP-binding protein
MRVTLERVAKRFGQAQAVSEVDLAIEEGELFFLLGPSGCGKTTLLRMLAGFEAPDSGVVRFDGQDVASWPPEKRGAGMVFQNYALWPHLSVKENVGFGLDVQGVKGREREERIHGALAMVKMEEYAARRPTQLSGGQQQRVALARALVIHPALILLDEPLSNLDARLRLAMRGEIRDIIKESGLTAVYVTHDQKEALAMADRCALLREGRVEQVGTPKDLYEHPSNRFVAEFLGETNLIPGVVTESDRTSQVTVRLAGGCDALWRGFSETALSPGKEVLCSIRPEAWRIGAHNGEGNNLLAGRVRSSVYLGEVTQHLVIPGGEGLEEIRVLELHHPSRETQEVTLSVSPSDTIVLEAKP